jgi:hypothetical protein
MLLLLLLLLLLLSSLKKRSIFGEKWIFWIESGVEREKVEEDIYLTTSSRAANGKLMITFDCL